MSKFATQELVLSGIQALMRPGERLVGLVRVVAGPWLYLAFLFMVAAVALVLSVNYVFGMVATLLALLCVLRIRGYALALTDQSLYVVRLKQGRVGTVEVIRPLSAVAFQRDPIRLELDGTVFWLRPLYLGADADEFERHLRAATGVAVAY